MLELKPVGEAFENDFSDKTGTRWKDEELSVVYQAMVNARNEMSIEETTDLAKELSEKEGFERTARGALFALNRMHVLIHGVAPHGVPERTAEAMCTPPETMIAFAEKQGIKTGSNIAKAKAEAKTRKPKIKRPEAMKMMSDYYMANKDKLPKDIAKRREEIIDSIMDGKAPEEAFAQFTSVGESMDRAKQERSTFLRRKPKAKPSVTIDTLSGEDKATALDLAKQYRINVLKTEGPIVTFDLDRDTLKSAVFLAKLSKEAQWDIV